MLIISYLPLMLIFQVLFICIDTQSVKTCGNVKCHHNSLCTDDGQACQCSHGFAGRTCEEDFDECDGHSPCYHRGHCRNSFGSYSCDCLQGWKNGANQHCEVKTSNDINVRKCMPGWTGDLCLDQCITDTDCKTSETCVTHGSRNMCTCRPGWKDDGTDCIDIDECKTTPCNSNEICTNTDGSYSCGCPSGFDGATCSHDIDECLSNHCSYSGICKNTIGSYKCNCLPGSEGENCQKMKEEGFAPSNIAMFSLAVGSFVFSIISIIVVVVTRYKCKGSFVNEEDNMECNQPRGSVWKANESEKNNHQKGEPQRNTVRIMSRTARISSMEFRSEKKTERNISRFQYDRPTKFNRISSLELENINADEDQTNDFTQQNIITENVTVGRARVTVLD